MAIADLVESPGPAALIPSWVHDLDSFRRWTQSEDFPDQGLFAFLEGDIWVDMSMEEIMTHYRVKFAMGGAFFVLLQETTMGDFLGDRVRWSNTEVGLSTEPDGLFHTWETLASGRLRYVTGAKGGIIEVEGTPDMALEILSATSVTKDTERLRDLYWRAGVTEYWLVDARAETLRFDILRHTPTGYVAVQPQDGWLTSTVFGRAFQLTRHADPNGRPAYKLAIR